MGGSELKSRLYICSTSVLDQQKHHEYDLRKVMHTKSTSNSTFFFCYFETITPYTVMDTRLGKGFFPNGTKFEKPCKLKLPQLGCLHLVLVGAAKPDCG